MFKIKLLLLAFCFTSIFSNLQAQRGDTTTIKKPEVESKHNYTPDFNQLMLGPDRVSLHNIKRLFEPEVKGYRFYQDLVWPTPQEKMDPMAIKLRMNFDQASFLKGVNNLSLNPDYLHMQFKNEEFSPAYLILALIASRFNNRIIGVDKEARIQIINNVYSKPSVPYSAKDPFKMLKAPDMVINYSKPTLDENIPNN